MFLFYYLWYFTYLFLNYTHVFIENNFLVKNNPFLIRKRTFKFLSYFEKLLLVFFHRKGWFEKSIANLYRKKDIIEYRRTFYPIIYSFHIQHNCVNYELDELKFFVKQFNYYTKKPVSKIKLKKILNVCLIKKNKNFIKFLILQKLYFKKYFELNNYFFFKKKSNLNIIKFNKIFSIFLIKSNYKLCLFNLDRWNDWYEFNFNNKFVEYCNGKVKLNKYQLKRNKDFKINKISKWINVVFKYKKMISNFNKFLWQRFQGIIHFKFSNINYTNIRIDKSFYKLLKYYIIKFSESSVTKHINYNSLKKYTFQFLRKNRIFNKGRYSRNRQLYRTGVYWCLWLNIIMVYGLYFMFYRFSFNFGYFWWGLLLIAYSTIFSRISKYNFYNINYLYKELINLINWYGFIFKNIIFLFENSLLKYFSSLNIFNYIIKYKKLKSSFFYDNFVFYIIKFSKKIIDKRKRMKIVYIWQGMKEKDESFLRYKTVIHWIKEIYRLIVT